MFEPLAVSGMAHALAAHASARQGVIAANVAHADTPGYRARDVEPFMDAFRRLQSEPPRTPIAPRLLPVDPGTALSPNGNSVSLDIEMMKAVEARHQFDMALTITQSIGGIIRTSLGR
ncbi:MAG: flagellar basal body protein [Alkalilacustris sp.]